MSNNKQERNRHFNLGYDVGKRFLEALQKGEISETDLRSKTPMIVVMLLDGPSEDFILGRIFEEAVVVAYDNVVKEDDAGNLKALDDWIIDEELKKLIADKKYNQANCRLLD